ncbi:hypothetical protein [Nocardia wallacei]|uniref:hypothetical protein n=1 Tax=Nocardia wallacei TaxID=480035 RepID=UPI0024561208|nr:hypothetical protein [Nocardia wallacei]
MESDEPDPVDVWFEPLQPGLDCVVLQFDPMGRGYAPSLGVHRPGFHDVAVSFVDLIADLFVHDDAACVVLAENHGVPAGLELHARDGDAAVIAHFVDDRA